MSDRSLRDEVKTLRDEMALKIHLASMDGREEWEKLESKWAHFSANAHLDQTGENLGAAMKLLGQELREGYRKLKKAL